MYLRAEVAGANRKGIELLQFTPMRDRGPILQIRPAPLWPSLGETGHPASRLAPPSQGDPEHQPDSAAYGPTKRCFERIQFTSATDRGSEQHKDTTVIVELLCDIRQGDSCPVWVVVAQRRSHPVIVRGHSPAHYQRGGPPNSISTLILGVSLGRMHGGPTNAVPTYGLLFVIFLLMGFLLMGCCVWGSYSWVL